MFKIIDNEITITKGDSGSFTIRAMNPDDSEYEWKDGDRLIFSLRERGLRKGVILEKEGRYIELYPEETRKMKCGRYLYDVVLYTVGGDVATIIPPTLFEVKEKMHRSLAEKI